MERTHKTGKVWLVGAGPGDTGLLTLKGAQVLAQAETVVYDRLVGDGVLAMMPSQARLINVGKEGGHHPVPQEEINRILLREAKEGRRVVRLKGGDPFVFGRGGEELELLAAEGIPFEVVPGITSAVAVPAYNGIPVTHRNFASTLHIITGHSKEEAAPPVNFPALVEGGGTLVFLMGVTALPKIAAGLIDGGMDPQMPAAILERGTTARQRRIVAPLEELPARAREAGIRPPSVIVVGRVCSLEKTFHWAEDRPLAGARVALTRPRELQSAAASRLRELGAEVLELPAIETSLLPDDASLRETMDRLDRYSWLVLTSPSGVRHLFEELGRMHRDVRSFHGMKIAAIGAATARELEARGLLADLVPARYSADQLGRELAAAMAPGERALLLRAQEPSPDLPLRLKEAGAEFDDIPLYRTIPLQGTGSLLAARLEKGELDYVTFTSASTVEAFVQMAGEAPLDGFTALCIGEKTQEAAGRHGMKTVRSQEATIHSLVDKLVQVHQEKIHSN